MGGGNGSPKESPWGTLSCVEEDNNTDPSGLWRRTSLERLDQKEFPKCQKCKAGDLVPLSDFGSQGATIHYKAWVCTNPDCGFNLKIRNGDIYINEPIMSGALHAARVRP